GTYEDLIEWLEVTATDAYVAEGVQAESLPIDIAALDALDNVVLPAVVETETSSATTLSPTEIEEGMKRLWRPSYAHYPSSEESRLETLFSTRGRGLAGTVIQDKNERRRLYRTSLSPRNGRSLLAAYPTIKNALQAGEEYAAWDIGERLRFVEGIV